MGQLEKAVRKARRLGIIQQALLTTVGITGLLLVTLAAPNTLQLLSTLGIVKKGRFNEKAQSALTSLAKRGCIVFESREGKKYARITDQGQRMLHRQKQNHRLMIKIPSRWDKRYRMVIFDIPERKRHIRRALREIIQEAGFLKLQGSVWVYPYDCEELIALLKADLHIGKDVLYTIVEKIENDQWIKTHFGLK